MVMAPPGYQCTASETVTNDAALTHACNTSAPAGAAPEVNGDYGPVKCINDQTVIFDDVIGAEGTITATDTFEEEPPPQAVEPAAATPAAVVAATPTFTG